MTINLRRLKLVAANRQMMEAEINDQQQLAQLLNVQDPYNWPPPLNDKNSQEFYFNLIKNKPSHFGWGMWYFILKNKSNNKDILIGNGGFKGFPNKNGEVEIGYSIIELYHGRGFATEAADGLIGWAFSNEKVKKVVAQTLVGIRPSIRVLEKNKFSLVGNTNTKGVIRFELEKNNYAYERG